MRREDLRYFRCPQCRSANLSVADGSVDQNEITEGELICCDCGISCPVHNSIPRFVSRKNYAESFGFQWTIHQKTQLDSYTGLPISRKRVFDVTGWPADLSGQVILEAGSGAGRFTEILLETGARVFSFDYSCAVEANWRNNGQSGSLQLFQGDLRNIPLERASFDKVLCLGVLQHTPCPEMAFKCLAEMVRPGGELVVDVYRRYVLALLQWKYVLRPITKRMSQQALYHAISRVVPLFVPAAKIMRKFGGRIGARIIPIVEYSHLGLPNEHNLQWAILDTFDMYSPSHDHPQSRETLERWYLETGFEDVSIIPGPNGLVGKGRRMASHARSHRTGIDNSKCVELSA